MKQPKSFYRRNTAFYLAVISIVGLVVTNIAGVILTRHDQVHRAAQIKASEQPKSREEAALINGAKYIRDSYALFEANQKLLLTYIQRKFEVADILPSELVTFNYAARPGNPEEIDYIYRIVDPNLLVERPPATSVREASRITMYSANCDRFQLPADFWKSVDRQIAAGGYELTHIALALVMMRDNGCVVPLTAASIETRVTSGMVELVNDPETVADLRYEAIVLLQMLGKRDFIEESWIKTIVTEQLSSGGWAVKKGETRENDHATVLAFWALLEYQNPGADEPLIRRPTR